MMANELNKKKTFIFGLGHLASFLLKELNPDSNIHGTCRTPQNETTIPLTHQIPYICGAPLPSMCQENWDVVIWSFPPVSHYLKCLKEAQELFPKNIPWIFISSTSVYKEGTVTEDSPRTATNFRGDANLVELEDYLMSLPRKVSILRPGGLVDAIRHPKKFIKGRTEIMASNSKLNLVHTQDVARFIDHVISKNLYGEHFNLVSDTQASKKEFYNKTVS